MSSDWKIVQLDEIAEFSQGVQVPVESQYSHPEEGLERFIRIVDYTNDNEPIRYLKKNKRNTQVSINDLVMVRYGSQTAGKVVRGYEGVIANNLFKINLKIEADKSFLYYQLSSDRVFNFLRQAQSSSTMPAITFGLMRRVVINLPPLPEQKAIAHILGTLDEKIELNRQMNQTLEAMAQALFKSWFVDFDPVIDNALTAGNEISEEIQARAEKRKGLSASKKLLSTNPSFAAQFPSSFVFNETLGKWIPEGWDFQAIGDHLYIKGRIGWKGLKRSEYSSEETGYRIVNGSDFQDEQINSKSCGWISKDRYDESPEIQLQENDILITKDGTIGKLAFVYNLNEKSSVASGVFVVRVISDQMSTMFCWSFFKSTLFQNVVKTKIDGSVIPHLYQRDFVEMYIPVPGKEILDQFENQSEAIFTKIFKNKLEIETITQLRDRLLPELISGRVRVPDWLLNSV